MPHSLFKRRNDDLYFTQTINFSDAVLGTEIEVPTIDKKWLKLKIPPGTQNNAKFRMKGYGMPRMGGKGRGDAYAEIQISIPKKLNDKQKSLVETLRDEGL
jgi:DnaJ-class molecular chaperone